MRRDKLTVIIPCLNEEQNVERAAQIVLGTAPKLPVDVELLLVDDGSTDRTRERMQAICETHQNARMRVNPKNLGLGRSVVQSYESIEPGSWVTVFPGDSEFVFESIQNHLAVRADYDLILGYVQNPIVRTIRRRVASQAFIEVVRFLYGFPYRYLNGMKLYRVEVFRGIEVISGGHGFNAELIAKAILRNPTLRIGEVPYVQVGRNMGVSKAFRARAVTRAAGELVTGYRSVSQYRDRVLRRGGPDGEGT